MEALAFNQAKGSKISHKKIATVSVAIFLSKFFLPFIFLGPEYYFHEFGKSLT
jgi:hypothetical protein